jgi:hypothetical protein
VNGTLQFARRELADLQAKLSDIHQQSASPPLSAQQPGTTSGRQTEQAPQSPRQ